MTIQSKILFFVICLCIFVNKTFAIPYDYTSLTQSITDSLIKEKNISSDMTQLELLVLYQKAWAEKHPDSINIFKNLATLNADLEQPQDAYFFTEKYIKNTLDFSILNDKSYLSIENTNEFKDLKDKYDVNFNLLTFFYLYVALIGFFFMLIINFTKKGSKLSKLLIAIFLGAHSLFIFEFVLYNSNLQYKFPHTYLMASSVALLYGPLLYFYYKSVVEGYSFKKLDILHVFPTIILLLFLSSLYLASSSEKIRMMLGADNAYRSYGAVIFISKIISLSIYGFLIGNLQFNSKKLIDGKTNNSSIKSWMKNIYRIHIMYIVSYIIYGFAANGSNTSQYASFVFHAQVVVMCFMIIYIAYMAYVQPQVFNNQYVSTPYGLFFEKYKKSGLTESLSNELKDSLVKLLVDDKIFKENDISLEKLSNKLNTTRHNTSQIINEHFNMNFFELINMFRIKEAINILQEDIHGTLNIIDIAYEVGYNNKVTFNKAFKKETSMTPSEFINSKLKSIH